MSDQQIVKTLQHLIVVKTKFLIKSLIGQICFDGRKNHLKIIEMAPVEGLNNGTSAAVMMIVNAWNSDYLAACQQSLEREKDVLIVDVFEEQNVIFLQ